MASTEDTRARVELRRALHEAGVVVDVQADHYHLDLSELDHHALVRRRQAALQTTASLLFSVDRRLAISAKLPLEPKSRRILSATGLMFALVEHSTIFEESTDTGSSAEEPAALFPLSDLLRLSTFDSWRTTFTPFDPGLRQLRLGSSSTKPTLGAVGNRSLREIGVYDKDLSAFVNPHHLPPSTAIQDIAQMAEPWLFKLLDDERSNTDKVVSVALELLEHALDNVREHAFSSGPGNRSLVTAGQVEVGDRQMFRLQIMDNGVGIPASLSSQINEPVNDRARAEHLVSLAVQGNSEDESPMLPWGRGHGLPRMRELGAQVDGILTIATRGPGGSQILITCEGDKPSQPYSDLVPVAGTVVTLLVPTQGPSIEVDEPIRELSDV